MMHKPIQIKNLCLTIARKLCFENFTTEIPYGSRIAIIGRNGMGKTSLLQILRGELLPTSGELLGIDGLRFGFVPQIIDNFDSLSGGQRLNKALTMALSENPDVLLLDEPSNHLDKANRQSLLRMLQTYPGTLIMVSHDKEYLSACVDTFWHIEQGEITIFHGHYADYIAERERQKTALEQELNFLNQEKREMHKSLMQEQQRAAKSRKKGEKSIQNKKWPTIVSDAKARRSEETSGRKKRAIDDKKSKLIDQIANISLPETIVPKFSLSASNISEHAVIAISDGSVQYPGEKPLLNHITLSISGKSRIVITGANASGKSTLIKAFLNDPGLLKRGQWILPKSSDIGYLDQHYANLKAENSVLETIQELMPRSSHQDVRRHLNDFLFRSNEEVEKQVTMLSGGEKARLSLAQIAAKTPKVLILDELTNNLDLETKEHLVQILSAYPGTLILISHDAAFIEDLGIEESIDVEVFK